MDSGLLHDNFVDGNHGADVDILLERRVTIGYFLEVSIHFEGLLLLVLVLVPTIEGMSEAHNILEAKEYGEGTQHDFERGADTTKFGD